MRWGAITALAAITCSMTLGTAVPTEARPVASWSVDLAAGEAVGIALDGGSARLSPGDPFASAAEEEPAAGAPPPSGLLTFPPHVVDTPTDRVTAVLDGALPAGSIAALDVRSRRSTGVWTEWVPADRDASGLTVPLPAPSSEVQARLVLAGDLAAGPVVRGVRLTAPQAQAAHLSGHNGGRDQYNREVANPTGIDLGDGMFWDALGLADNGWV